MMSPILLIFLLLLLLLPSRWLIRTLVIEWNIAPGNRQLKSKKLVLGSGFSVERSHSMIPGYDSLQAHFPTGNQKKPSMNPRQFHRIIVVRGQWNLPLIIENPTHENNQ